MSENSLPICPLTGRIIQDPVITPDGNTYEKFAIEEWLKNISKTDPLTNNSLRVEDLIPNIELKNLYEKHMNKSSIIEEFTIDNESLKLEINIKNTDKIFDILTTIKSPEIDEEDNHDIILCLDVSGSMTNSADRQGIEKTGLNIFDILKHGVKTIINTCNSKHRIGIVTFSVEGIIRCPLVTINENGKNQLNNVLERITLGGNTNLYDGIIKSYSLIKSREKKNIKSTIIIFTDGEPNVDPPGGYISELKIIKENNGGKYPCDINIYTFGNNVNSQLSDEISRETGGVYGYMPDSSFIGDLLEHKIASIRTCRAKNCLLKIEVENIKNFIIYESLDYKKINSNSIQINVGDILYGQNRNFVISVELNDSEDKPKIFASLDYNENNSILNIQCETITEIDNFENIVYNKIRHELINVITYIINYNDCNDFNSAKLEYNNFLTKLNLLNSNDERLANLKKDFNEQIKLAFQQEYYNKWGYHYLLSIKRAYQIEQCNNFKDFGIQHFTSKLFTKILDNADYIFNKMPPPKPINSYTNDIQQSIPVNMNNFNSRYGACFHGLSLVTLSDNTKKLVSEIVKGDIVKLGNGLTSTIECVVKTIYNDNYINLISLNKNLHITHYHPVKISNIWFYPRDLPNIKYSNLECDSIYSFVLNDRGNGSGIIIGDIECATLGHNIASNYVIYHPFFGTENVINNLKKSNNYDNGLIIISPNNFKRDPNTNLIFEIIF
jgi:hypothetical protein